MKQICIDARMSLHGGIGTYIRAVLPYIQKAFPSVQVLAPISLIEKWPLLEKFDLIPLKAPIYSIQEQWKMPLRIPACDLFWSPHYNVPLLPLPARKRLVTIHDVYHLVFANTLGFLKRSYAKFMLPKAAQLSDHIVTVSNFSLEEILQVIRVPKEKISVIPNGVHHDQFSYPALPSQLEKVRSLYLLPQNYFVCVSTWAAHKNLTWLLKAWSFVVKKHPNWHLILIGKKPKSVDKFFRSFEGQAGVKHLGWVPDDDLPSLYQNAHGLIYPSIYEGFGLPPLEAMAMRCPTIVSKAASLPEVCGDASLYVDPFNEEDIVQKICILIENLAIRQTLIEKGRQRIEQFNWEKTAQLHLQIMDWLIS